MIARVSWCLILCRFHDKRHENGTKMTAWCSREVCAFTRCCSRHRKHFSSKFSNVTITHSAPGIICCDRQLRVAIDFPDWCNNTIAMFLFLHTISHFHLTPSHLSHWVVAATNHLTARWKHIHHFCVCKQQTATAAAASRAPSFQLVCNTSLEINAGISIKQGIWGELACQINEVQFMGFNCQPFSPLLLKCGHLIH